MAHVPPSLDDQAMMQRFKQVETRAQDLTDNALTFERSTTELGNAIRKVTKLEDKEIDVVQQMVDARAARGEITGIACAKGCWYCCTQLVAVTIPEVLRVADHIRAEWSPEETRALRERIDSFMTASADYLSGRTDVKPRHVCPLLQSAACSVWTVRPIVCRGHNSTDVEACIRRRDDPVNDPPIPTITGQTYIAMSSRTGMRRGLKKHGLDQDLHELVSALKIALDNPEAGARYMAGEPLFESTKVPGRDI